MIFLLLLLLGLASLGATPINYHLSKYNSLPDKGYYRVYQHVVGYYQLGSDLFDQNHKKRDLNEVIFGKNLLLKDIYLASKMSMEGKLTLPAPIFGALKEEQYLNLLANTKLHFDLDEKTAGGIIKTLYVIPTNKFIKSTDLCFCLDIPLIIKQRHIDLSSEGGVMSSGASGLGPYDQFFTENQIDFLSFFRTQVLSSKNLQLKKIQSKGGIGNCTFYLYSKYANVKKNFNEYNCGIGLQLPTAYKARSKKVLWEIDLCSKYAVWLGLFFNASIQTNYAYINPYFEIAVGYDFPYHAAQRIPIKKNQNEVNLPSAFNGFTRLAFSSFDSLAKEFADEVSSCSISGAQDFSCTVGNSFRYYLGTELELLMYLQFYYQQKNKFTPINAKFKDRVFDKKILEDCTHRQYLDLNGQMRFYVSNHIRLAFGFEKILTGKNVLAGEKLFFQIALSY